MKRFVEFPDGSTFLLSAIDGFHIFEPNHMITIFVKGQLYSHGFFSEEAMTKFIEYFKEEWMRAKIPTEDFREDIGNLMVKLDKALEELR